MGGGGGSVGSVTIGHVAVATERHRHLGGEDRSHEQTWPGVMWGQKASMDGVQEGVDEGGAGEEAVGVLEIRVEGHRVHEGECGRPVGNVPHFRIANGPAEEVQHQALRLRR
eukprot:TRINITY_DN1680_c0_g1_i2.p7 TRINITY_DN1680_c0_g1~~TRINITY_DN1680_c0_g1_i2.p7  ORF type:complete len:112 (-),score=8.12 TRINITY_DN1680_c0_g1_i2:560-895(-)